MMEFCRNKRSGMYFIYIEDTPDEKLLLVTPLAEIKALDDPSLFDPPDEKDVAELLSRELLKKEQIRRYKEFIEKDSIKIFTQEHENEEDLDEALKRAKEKMCNSQWDYVMEKLEGLLTDSREKTNGKR
jgi:L-rhamnose mutarotase